MKIGLVIPYSWSFWGAVVEISEQQAGALSRRGIEVVRIMGYDPPGRFRGMPHPRTGRSEELPPDVIPVGGSVIVPANDSRPNILLSPTTPLRVRRALRREKFDLLHLHEPITPVPCLAALALSDVPIVGTFHASGGLRWNYGAKPAWGYLMNRIDHRIAVSEVAKHAADRWYPGEYEIIPNGTILPPQPVASDRESTVVFATRNERRKGLRFLLEAWPEIRRQTGLRLRLAGAEPYTVYRLMHRLRTPDDGIDVLGHLSQERLTEELCAAKAAIAPSIRGESFGMQLTRAFGCATPVVASDIDGYRDVMRSDVGFTAPPQDPEALARAVVDMVSNEPRRVAMGERARALAQREYDWDLVADRLIAIYEQLLGRGRRTSGARTG